MSNRTPPFSEDIEKAVIGSIFLDPINCLNIADQCGISTNTFYGPVHQRIYQAICELSTNGKFVDALLVGQILENELSHIGGQKYLDDIIDATPTAAHMRDYCEKIRSKEILRKVIAMSSDAIERAYKANENGDGAEVAESVTSMFFDALEIPDTPLTKVEALNVQLSKWKDAMAGKKDGIESYLYPLTQTLGPFKPGWVHVVAAPPSAGKTTFLTNHMRHWAQKGIPGAFASLEVGQDRIFGIMAAEMANVSTFALDTGFNKSEYETAEQRLRKTREAMIQMVGKDAEGKEKFPLWVNDKEMDVEQLAIWTRMMKMKYNIQYLGVDYLQLLEAPSKDRNKSKREQIDSVLKKLKFLAKELNLVVILLSQLTKEGRTNTRRPSISDLKESGAIEEIAYSVMLLYEWDVENTGQKDYFCNVAKNKGGITREIQLKFIKNRQRIESDTSWAAKNYSQE